MSASLARLRKRAAELEQKKQFDRALEVYIQILDEGGKDLDDEDVPLFNRVGDMLMRKGSVTEALGYYERAVDMYAERGYLNNAIALCSKILRQSPGRAAVYYKLARISAKKGFKSDARKNFLEYADRMQKLGMADEAFRALKEFASLYPDQDDVRLVLAELLSKENRKGEALEQLQSLYEKLQSEGRAAEARATVDRMRAIDPSVTPREGTQTQTPAVGDLVFLDLNDAEAQPARKTGDQPASARAPAPSPVPALTGLSITFFPEETEAPRPEGFESTAVEPEPVETTPVTRSLTPLGSELVVEPAPDRSSPPEVEPIEIIANDPEPIERVEHLVEDLLPEPGAESGQESGMHNVSPLSGSEFADLELDALTHEYEVRAHDLSLPGDLPTPDGSESVPAFSPASAAAAEDARAAAEEAADLAADVAAREAAHQGIVSVTPVSISEPDEPDELVQSDEHDEAGQPVESASEPEVVPVNFALAEDLVVDEPVVLEAPEIPDDFLAVPPSFGGQADTEDDHAFPPLFGMDESTSGSQEIVAEHSGDEEEPETELEPVPTPPAPRTTVSIGSAESHLRGRLELDPENWELHRQLGEALLDSGDRDGGLHELELAMAGFELRGDMDRAQEVVDEIIGISPGSVSHHQKRVEFAVRSRDRSRLTHSYLELADALFRTGAADKAVAVYGRVLELDAANERAEFALATLAPDELVRLRGGPVRPERWTDELAALDGDRTRAPQSPAEPAASVAPDEANGVEPTDAPPKAEKSPASPRVRFRTLDLPVADWGEGVPRRPSAETPSSASRDKQASNDDSFPSAPDEKRGVEVESPIPDELQEVSSTSAVIEEAVDSSLQEIGEPPVAEPPVAEPRDATPYSVPATREPTPLSAPLQRAPTPLSVPTQRPPTPLSNPVWRPPTPLSVPTPRAPTPLSVPVTQAPSEPPFAEVRSERPLGDDDSEFVDLGDWLRRTEPVRSTRMQVEDPKPTGDEQADFEEMLRRFKRGVAENVEAEDYEAHYDLGVAYKEMGLIDEAIAQFQKALRAPGQRVRSYEALGQCFVEKQQFPIAAALLQRATEVPGSDDQQLVGVLYLLGFATEHLGRPAEALPYYLRVFAVDIEFRDIAERVAALGNHTK